MRDEAFLDEPLNRVDELIESFLIESHNFGLSQLCGDDAW